MTSTLEAIRFGFRPTRYCVGAVSQPDWEIPMHFTAFDAYAELPALPESMAIRTRVPELTTLAILAALWCVAAVNTSCAALMIMGVL